MPPEQASGKIDEVTESADVFSLGAILYCLITGRPPFQAASQMDTLLQVLEKEPVPPRQFNPAIPRDVETICLKCLRKDSQRRYDSATALAEDLGRWLNQEPILARPVSRAEKTWLWCRRKPAVAGSIAAIVVAAVIVMVVIGVQRRQNTLKRVRTAVANLSGVRGTQIPDSIKGLEEFPREMVVFELRKAVHGCEREVVIGLCACLF